ncbi:MAG: histidine kinase [Lachnospiraceae bacterium]|nr:histidine kinase [Lachnospiraceae bacterium]
MLKKWLYSLRHIQPMLQNKYFIKNLTILIGSILLLFFASTYMVNSNSRKILENELLASDRNYIEIVNNSVDSVLFDMRYIAATLNIDTMVSTFLLSEQPEDIISDFYLRLQEKLDGYVNSYPCIHSIYLYSGITDTIITSSGKFSVSTFKDLNWMEYFTEEPEPYIIFSRLGEKNYPNFLCIMKQIKLEESTAAIVINIQLKDIPILSETKQRYSDIYIINDDSQVIYHANQRYLLEPLSISDNLKHFSAEADEASLLSTSAEKTYAYTQLHSAEYPFSYVLITNLENYSEELSSRQTIFFTIFIGLFLVIVLLSMIMGLRFFKPIEMLTQLLNESSDFIENTDYPSQEISDLANKIISYAQTNRQLADELAASLQRLTQSQMLALQVQLNPHFLFNTLSIIHIKECQELGYTHPLPEMTLKLSRILRHAISSTDMVTLQFELEYIKQYIDLMKFRDLNEIIIQYDINEKLLDTMVPKLFIQPLIENVFLHAFPEDYRNDNHLILSIQEENNNCVVILSDNGIGMTPEKCNEILNYFDEDSLPVNSIGVKNVIRRMKLIYGDSFTLKLHSKEKEGTSFCLIFPKKGI